MFLSVVGVRVGVVRVGTPLCTPSRLFSTKLVNVGVSRAGTDVVVMMGIPSGTLVAATAVMVRLTLGTGAPEAAAVVVVVAPPAADDSRELLLLLADVVTTTADEDEDETFVFAGALAADAWARVNMVTVVVERERESVRGRVKWRRGRSGGGGLTILDSHFEYFLLGVTPAATEG